MKKKVLIFISIILFTGCTANYNLEIDNDSFMETITFPMLKSETSYDEVNEQKEIEVFATTDSEEKKVYDSNITEDTNYYYLNYTYKHDITSLKKNYFINRCYDNFEVDETDDEIVLSTDDQFNCIYMDDGAGLDSAQINITTKLKVLENNADKVSGNTYTWNIDAGNYQNKPIKIKVKRDFDVKSSLKKNEASYFSGIIALSILIVCLIIFIFIKIKEKKNNKFV